MAVVRWLDPTKHWVGPRNFHPPKRADLKAWYREARKSLSDKLPAWRESFYTRADITENSIAIDLGVDGVLYIARKQWLR